MTDVHYALPKGYLLYGYEIIRVLGVGGFGITYLAFDDEADRAVAIKEYFPAEFASRRDAGDMVLPSVSAESDFRWGLDRFLDEARNLLRINHPNIVEVERFLEANGTAYIVMEYVEGCTLTEYLERSGSLDEAELTKLLLPILEGLERVHDIGLLHRDIKPANIVLRAPDDPVLIDFGAARFATSQHSKRLTRIFTRGFSPYEQYAAEGRQGPWTDIYALAAVCYMCLTGRAPEDCNSRIASDSIEPLVDVAPEMGSAQFLAAIDWGMSVFEDDRPQDITSWLQALSGKKSQPGPRAPTDTQEGAPTNNAGFVGSRMVAGRRRWGAISAMLVTIMIVAMLSTPQARREALSMLGLIDLYALDLTVSPVTATVRLVGEGYDENWRADKRFPVGDYDLHVSDPFHQPTVVSIALPHEAPMSIDLERNQFPMTVQTVPQDAQVKIAETGEPVINGQLVDAGEWTLQAQADFHREQTLPVRLDEPKELAIELERIAHELTIHVVPADADAAIRLLDPQMPYRSGAEIPAGPITAQISADGYETQERIFILDDDTVLEIALECEYRTVNEQRCEQRTRTEYRTESEERSDRISEEGSYTGPWRMPAYEVCERAARRAQRELRDECDRRGSSASLSDRDEECTWRTDCEIAGRRGNAAYFEDRYECEAIAYGRCEWDEDRRVPEQVAYEHCEDVEVERPVCEDERTD